MEGHSVVSADVLASYAADAAREIEGVHGVVDSQLHRHRGVRIVEDDNGVTVELHLALDWDASAPDVGTAVQQRVRDYLSRMADVTPRVVDVVIDEIAAPAA